MHLLNNPVSDWRGLSYSLILRNSRVGNRLQAGVVFDGKIKQLMLGLNTACMNKRIIWHNTPFPCAVYFLFAVLG